MAMSSPERFMDVAADVVSRHRDTGLASRWEDAREPEPDVVPDGFWIRETDDLVNIVWITPRGISDITWLPGRQMSTFNFLRLSDIIGMEMREAPEAANTLGVGVSGNVVVTIRPSGDRAALLWVAADDPSNVDGLRKFAGLVIRKMAEG